MVLLKYFHMNFPLGQLEAIGLKEQLSNYIKTKSAKIGIIGLGYVGLPMAEILVNAGYQVIGLDINADKIEDLKKGKSPIKHFENSKIQNMNISNKFHPTIKSSDLSKADIILICVPTPINKNQEPNLACLDLAVQSVIRSLKQGQLIILESTTYPYTTKNHIRPKLEETGLLVGKDIFLAYAPEREDPGNETHHIHNTTKIVGADDANSLKLTQQFYQSIISDVITTSSSATAEAVKLYENTFRMVNIGLANEMKVIFSNMGIDIWEVIEAAKTKPFGFMPFYPGPGVGGHCIPVDPLYLLWKAKEFGDCSNLINFSHKINKSMPKYVVERLRDALDQEFGMNIKDKEILIVGITYKKNIDDIRESPGVALVKKLLKMQAKVDYYDPYIPEWIDEGGKTIKSVRLSIDCLKKYKAAIICTAHDMIDYQIFADQIPLIVDTQNILNRLKCKKTKVVNA